MGGGGRGSLTRPLAMTRTMAEADGLVSTQPRCWGGTDTELSRLTFGWLETRRLKANPGRKVWVSPCVHHS